VVGAHEYQENFSYLISSSLWPALTKTQTRDIGSAVLRFRRRVLDERLLNEYALKEGNYRQMKDEENQELGDFLS
jgi:hypothetical protein